MQSNIKSFQLIAGEENQKAKQTKTEDKPIKEQRAMNQQIETMTDEELIAYTHKAASDLSYHNAAEGEQYFKEAPQADEARGRYRSGRDAMEARGLTWENKGYLIAD